MIAIRKIPILFISVVWIFALSAIGYSVNPYRSNGEAIYYNRTNEDGIEISYEEGPKWLEIRTIGCVACHGADGKGGYVIWPSLKTAPDIRYDSLVMEEHAHGGKAESHPRYTDDLIKRAINEGIDTAGKTLDPIMPRWKLSEKDLADLLAYLKQLSEGIAPPPEPFPREP